MRLLRVPLLISCCLLLVGTAASGTTQQIGVDGGWVAAVHLQRGWLVTVVMDRIVRQSQNPEHPGYSWNPPLRAGDIITKIADSPASDLSPLTVMAMLQMGLWRQTSITLERDGRSLTVELNHELGDLDLGHPINSRELKLVDSAPEFSLPDLNGTLTHSSELRGTWVLMNFWGTWCRTCYQEFPALNDFADLTSDRVRVLGVAMKDEPETLRKFLLSHDLRYSVLLGGGFEQALATSYDVNDCPTNVVIAPDGTVRFAGVGPRSLETAVRTIVNALKHQTTSEAR